MDEQFNEMVASLREGRRALDAELSSMLEAQLPDWSRLERLRDVADEYALRARVLRQMMIEREADADRLEEVDQLCKYFDGTTGLIAQRTGDDLPSS